MPLKTPRRKKRAALLQTLKPVFRSHRSRPVAEVIARINPILRGWVRGISLASWAGRAGPCRRPQIASQSRFPCGVFGFWVILKRPSFVVSAPLAP